MYPSMLADHARHRWDRTFHGNLERWLTLFAYLHCIKFKFTIYSTPINFSLREIEKRNLKSVGLWVNTCSSAIFKKIFLHCISRCNARAVFLVSYKASFGTPGRFPPSDNIPFRAVYFTWPRQVVEYFCRFDKKTMSQTSPKRYVFVVFLQQKIPSGW
jgi:hypothetical protein